MRAVVRADDPVCDVWFPFAPQKKEEQGFIGKRYRQLQQALFSHCEKSEFYRNASLRYASLAADFNHEMGGRYPFAPLGSADHSLLDVYEFLSHRGDDIDDLYDDFSAFAGDNETLFNGRVVSFLSSLRYARHIIHAIAPINQIPLQLRFDIGHIPSLADDRFFRALYVKSGVHQLSLARGAGTMNLRRGDGIDLSLAWGQRDEQASSAWYDNAIYQSRERMNHERYASHGSWGLLRLIERYGMVSRPSFTDAAATALLRLPMALEDLSLDLLVRVDIERGERALALDLVESLPFPHHAPTQVSMAH